MIKTYTEITTSYIPERGITVIWQDLYTYVEGEGDTCIQSALIGWYHGEPNDYYTAFYSNNALIANYVDCSN